MRKTKTHRAWKEEERQLRRRMRGPTVVFLGSCFVGVVALVVLGASANSAPPSVQRWMSAWWGGPVFTGIPFVLIVAPAVLNICARSRRASIPCPACERPLGPESIPVVVRTRRCPKCKAAVVSDRAPAAPAAMKRHAKRRSRHLLDSVVNGLLICAAALVGIGLIVSVPSGQWRGVHSIGVFYATMFGTVLLYAAIRLKRPRTALASCAILVVGVLMLVAAL